MVNYRVYPRAFGFFLVWVNFPPAKGTTIGYSVRKWPIIHRWWASSLANMLTTPAYTVRLTAKWALGKLALRRPISQPTSLALTMTLGSLPVRLPGLRCLLQKKSPTALSKHQGWWVIDWLTDDTVLFASRPIRDDCLVTHDSVSVIRDVLSSCTGNVSVEQRCRLHLKQTWMTQVNMYQLVFYCLCQKAKHYGSYWQSLSCVLTLSGAIIWISCRLCAGDCSRRTDRSTPPKSTVYQWDSLTSQRK